MMTDVHMFKVEPHPAEWNAGAVSHNPALDHAAQLHDAHRDCLLGVQVSVPTLSAPVEQSSCMFVNSSALGLPEVASDRAKKNVC
jgi:hypothetical protein